MNKSVVWIGLGILGVSVLLYGVWFFIFSPSQTTPTESTQGGLGSSDTRTSVGVVTPGSTNEATNTTTGIPVQSATQKIFKISDGPVNSATFIETSNPTTTLARYIFAHNGHTQDIAIDVPGSIAKSVSNTTIPGIMRSVWGAQGSVVIVQYLENTVVKTASLSLSVGSSTLSTPARIQFFPDGIVDIVLSPNSKQAVYLLRTSKGIDGYVSASDGKGGKKLFSIPLTQVSVAWPSAATILVQTKNHSESPGMLFSVDTASGNVVPLLYATGLSATASPNFSYVVYQIVSGVSSVRNTYVRDTKTGTDSKVSFSPFPEKCTWNRILAAHLYCATPTEYIKTNYFDLWHMGTASVADSIVHFNVQTGLSAIVSVPGGEQGGEDSDIAELAVSSDNKYLLFIRKGDRSLWGVRLTQ